MDQPEPGYRRDVYQPPPLMATGGPPYQYRAPVGQYQSMQYRNQQKLGPCYGCGGYGHLVASCKAKDRLYPLYQPVVSSAADVSEFVGQSSCGTCVDSPVVGKVKYNECVDGLVTEPAKYKEFIDSLVSRPTNNIKYVDNLTAGAANIKGCVDNLAAGPAKSVHKSEGIHEMPDVHQVNYNGMSGGEACPDITQKFWEAESSGLQQITDIQGRLKKNIEFLENVLDAPPPVLDCIRNGYRLPLKFIPLHTSSIITNLPQATVILYLKQLKIWLTTDVQHKWRADHIYVALFQLCQTPRQASSGP